jgi:hypothetical protein
MIWISFADHGMNRDNSEASRGSAVPVLVLSGSMGSGKTTVMAETSDLLAARNIPHAAIDLDALGVAHLPRGNEVALRNLTAVWRNFAEEGASRLLLAVALESLPAREQLQLAVPGAEMVVCRLRAGLSTMQQRVRLREPGIRQAEFVARSEELEKILDASRLENFSVDNDGRSVTEVAREVLARAGWLRS